ncbi:MAG TPA: hypothetical protein VGV36_02845, partial [Solirubrobacteraceae bacterium]|nr:hypothetical protein [Solirubrobacteraceae bacterium]
HPPVRRIVLPSGRMVEVLLFDRTEPGPEPAPAPPGLHVCTACGSDLVHPVHWEEADTEHWEVLLRCPDCGEQTSGIFAEEAIARLDEELDRGSALLVEALHRLSRANFEEDIERFARALQGGLVLPEDF